MIHAVNLSGGEARQYRLLYRGSLSLPDSEVVLDGWGSDMLLWRN